jgi:glyoxylase-like metal-dependent hydrolase (beta-lactamase superfamily II)
MTWITKEGSVNENTFLIDSLLNDEKKVMASFLFQGTKKKALIDSSGPENAFKLVDRQKSMNLIPDILILTHSHWDHAGGAHIFQERIPSLEILAGKTAINALKNNINYNEPFSALFKELKPIERINVVKEVDEIDLRDLNLTIYETPGHIDCCISIFDQKNKILVIGDSLGYLWTKNVIIPPIMPPEFSEEKFLTSIKKINKINCNSLYLAHYGFLKDNFAQGLPDMAKKCYFEWRDFFISKWKEEKNINYVITKFINQLGN